MTTAIQKIKSVFGVVEEEPTTTNRFWESFEESTTLSRTQRLYGFCICFAAGFIFCFTAMWFVWLPATFATLYTLGLISFIGSTFFLMGPMNQLKSMMKQHRILASIAFLVLICLTLWAAFGVGSTILVLIFFILQLIALGWYVLTYIPYGQQAAGSFLSAFFS